jgi:hypothetical protein
MGDQTGCKISKAYVEACGIWQIPPIINLVKTKFGAEFLYK